MQHEFLSLDDKPFTFELPPARGTTSFFVMAPHKAGSVLLFSLVRDLAEAAGHTTADLPGQAFEQGVTGDVPIQAWMLLDSPGQIFIGFRGSAPPVRAYRTSRKILLVRDPRDIAVSYYFSMRYSHVMPAAGRAADDMQKLREESAHVDIETFLELRRADFIFQNMRKLADDISRFSGFRIFRYEDVIFEKERFATELASELELDIPKETIVEIAGRYDIRPTEEQPNEHVRQVTPGNHKVHLTQLARRRIELFYGDVFEAFGYPISE